MNMVSFFAAVAANFKSRYDQLNQALSQNKTPDYYYGRPSTTLATTSTDNTEPAGPAEDSVEISPDARQLADQSQTEQTQNPATAPSTNETSNDGDSETPAAADKDGDEATETPAAPVDPPTYSFQQQSRLDYKMNLQFDLGTFTRTLESLSEGDTKSVEELFAAGFGLSADLAFRGSSITQASGATDGASADGKQISATRARARGVQSSYYKAAGDNFAVESFTREAHRIQRSSLNINRNGHQLAINRFAMRYSLDSKFSVANLNRFNLQTKQVADQSPDAVNQYIDSAGQVAEKGSTDMMATFFDTVDSYLGQAEDRLTENAQAFLDAAAKELGFSDQTISMAKDQLVGSIQNFFDRVDSAISQLQTKYVPQTTPIPPQTSEPTQLVTPEQLYKPAVAQDEQTVAVA